MTEWITASATVANLLIMGAFFYWARREARAVEKLLKEVNKVTP